MLSALLERSGRPREDISPSEALSVIWAVTGTDLYNQLVSGRRTG